MRRSIRLTGRRQLPITAFDFQLLDIDGKKQATLAVVDGDALKDFPENAEVRVKLIENKFMQILRFGAVNVVGGAVDLGELQFLAPSCQVRIVSLDPGEQEGKLLGSTSTWTYKSDGDSEGILMFQAAPTAPRMWRLEIRPEEYPILYVDERIPNAAVWAREDAVFIASVLPHVITEVLRNISRSSSEPETGWMADWLDWAEKIAPGYRPEFGAEPEEWDSWIDTRIESFCARHSIADQVVKKLSPSR